MISELFLHFHHFTDLKNAVPGHRDNKLRDLALQKPSGMHFDVVLKALFRGPVLSLFAVLNVNNSIDTKESENPA